jgi:putative SOS response-associated peptidase YedK
MSPRILRPTHRIWQRVYNVAMCGRFALKTLDAVFEEFAVPFTQIEMSFNIAPTQSVVAVRETADQSHAREVALLHWGLVPPFAKDVSMGNKMINARAETLIQRPVFRKPFERRRCLIPADGFYEWKKEGKAKRPFFIRRKDGHLLGFAGLWERWRDEDGQPLESCTIITTAPNEMMASIHDRMPAIIEPRDYGKWLNPDTPIELLRPLLEPIPSAELDAHEVDAKVGRPTNNSPDCMEPIKPTKDSLFD